VVSKTLLIKFPAAGESSKPEAAERFSGLIFLNPPFILEKRQIFMQGSLSGWVGEVVRNVDDRKNGSKMKEFLWK
jgi:hypothetical protein